MPTTTLKDIARKAGISVSTTSLILNGRGERYSAATRELVLKTAEELNYRPNSMAHRIGRNSTRSDSIGFLMRSESASKLANAPAYEFICGINDVFLEHNQFMVMVKLDHLYGRNSDETPRVISERFIDGIIVETGLPRNLHDAISRYSIPAVWLNCGKHDNFDCVYPDELYAASKITQYLIRLGHKRISYMGVPDMSPDISKEDKHFSLTARPEGYAFAMQQAGLNVDIVIPETRSEDYLQILIDRIIQSRSAKNPVTAVITHQFSDVPHIQRALAEKGIKCPEEVSLATIEDVHLMRRSWPEVTGISCDRYSMGKWAAEMMLAKVEDSNSPQKSRIYQGQLITGRTVCPVKS